MPRGIRRFDHPIRARVLSGSKRRPRRGDDAHPGGIRPPRFPILHLAVVTGDAPADVEVRLIDEKNFKAALEAAFGARIARRFIARTDPHMHDQRASRTPTARSCARCRSSSSTKATGVFFDCAYHELLHAFGLSNHDQRNPWTTLNQRRMVGYLSVYDHALLTLLYDPRIRPGMSRAQAARPAAAPDRRASAWRRANKTALLT